MRDIKFRGYSQKYESWFYGYLVPNAKGNIQIKHILDNGNTAMTTVEISTIGQYTGLKDINGKEIYEGDILRMHYIKNGTEELIASVVYSEDYAQYVINNDKYRLNNYEPLCDYEDLEVIGNIYDNPDLIKE